MIYSKEATFVHVPKTGGMSVTQFLVNALDCPMTIFAQEKATKHSQNAAGFAASAGTADFRGRKTP